MIFSRGMPAWSRKQPEQAGFKLRLSPCTACSVTASAASRKSGMTDTIHQQQQFRHDPLKTRKESRQTCRQP